MGEWKQVATSAERIQKAMDETGKKQADLVEATGLNKSTISRYLSGQVEPKQKAIMTLAQALNVSEMWLWGYDVPKERPASQKKTDKVSHLFDKMLRDPTFLEMADRLSKMDHEKRASLLQMIEMFDKK